MIFLGTAQGLLSIGLGLYIDKGRPSRTQIFPEPLQDTDLGHSSGYDWPRRHSSHVDRGCEWCDFLTGTSLQSS